jgi:glucose-1-phosphate adenylyltransferase
MFFSQDVMLQLLREQFPRANDFGSEVIPGATSIGKRVHAYLYDGYLEDIGTINTFYDANLIILHKKCWTAQLSNLWMGNGCYVYGELCFL